MGRGVDFYISPTDPVERKALLDALKDLVILFRSDLLTVRLWPKLYLDDNLRHITSPQTDRNNFLSLEPTFK